jgi:NAD(P)-dependent dehydrogenase (short-subunit alcohol dehydrogenase family)
LDGRVALVTGAGRGLGKAMVQALAEAGAKVVLADVDRAALLWGTSGPERMGDNRALSIVCDITQKPDCERAVAAALDAFGRLDILVNNAGRGPNHVTSSPATKSLKFWEADPDRWEQVIRTNVVGTFFMAQAAAPHMIAGKWGRIINITTSLSTMQRRANSPYGVSKTAIEAETLIWAQDLEGTGVTVNSLIPGGAADTEFVSPPTREAALAGKTKLLPPSVMIPPLLWLASTLSDGVTGARFVGKLWDVSLRPEEAASRAREAPILRKPAEH